ncbi:MAG: PDZ domain-containing protein [Candidatus Acidiferrales bacterium]
MSRFSVRAWVATMAFFGAASFASTVSAKPAPCQSMIEYVGICDPYVPGTIITIPRDKPITVLSTWPQGPAERSGICSGDEILAVNGVSTLSATRSRLLEEIVSDAPTSVRLQVKRGTQTKEYDVGRVRESTLAGLSRQKYAVVGGLFGFFGPVELFPLDEREDEIQGFRDFHNRLFAAFGFKPVDGVYVPSATPEAQVETVLLGRQSNRLAAQTGLNPNPEGYSAGFLAMFLTSPDELVVETVLPDSPAYHAGLLPGDRVEEIDGRAVPRLGLSEIEKVLSNNKQPRQIELKVNRGGSVVSLSLGTRTMKELEQLVPDRIIPTESPRSPGDYILGIETIPAEKLHAVVIAVVQYPSPAFSAGLHVGDVLLTINRQPVARMNDQELSRLLSPTSAEMVLLGISRLKKRMSVTLTPVTYRAALEGVGRKPTKLGTAPESCPNS